MKDAGMGSRINFIKQEVIIIIIRNHTKSSVC